MKHTRPLGPVQQSVLEFLREFTYWRKDGFAWVWGSTAQTQRIMDALVKRKLAYVDKNGLYRPTKEAK